MFELLQISESHELSDALEKLGQEAARLQTVIDMVPSFLWTSLPDGSKEYLNKRCSVRICFTASTSFQFDYRHCASGLVIFRC
jgi:hypothetical protein